MAKANTSNEVLFVSKIRPSSQEIKKYKIVANNSIQMLPNFSNFNTKQTTYTFMYDIIIFFIYSI